MDLSVIHLKHWPLNVENNRITNIVMLCRTLIVCNYKFIDRDLEIPNFQLWGEMSCQKGSTQYFFIISCGKTESLYFIAS